jgi:glycogen synthase
MKIAFLTNEYPPHIYGGAGVHVEYLSRELADLEDKRHAVKILCFGEQEEYSENKTVKGINPDFTFPSHDPRHQKFLHTLLRNLVMAGSMRDVDIVHCHTWYTHLAGCLLKHLLGVPLVLTTHSLEPQRPWKEEQLGSAYQVSTWVEKTAYENADGVIAVSQSMKTSAHEIYSVPLEKIRVIYNGIDTNQYKPTPNPAILASYQIRPDQPFILFVGRITRQKGVFHLLDAVKYLRPGVQIVFCAASPDTEEIAKEMVEKTESARTKTQNEVIWISQMVPREDLISLYTHASIFVCPSIYEPFGIINVEAMACQTPVVASSVGGIKEAVVHGETGLLVPFEPLSARDPAPKHPEQFAQGLASAINSLLSAPEKMRAMGINARWRVEKYFSWTSIAQQTLEFYREMIRFNNNMRFGSKWKDG